MRRRRGWNRLTEADAVSLIRTSSQKKLTYRTSSELARYGCKISNSPWRPILARIRRSGRLGQRFEEKRQKRQRSTTPLQSDLAQETCPTPPRGQTEEAGMLRGGASTSRQAQVETSQLGARLREHGGPELSLSLISTAPSLSSQTRCRFRHYDRARTNIENGGLLCGTHALQTLPFFNVMLSCPPNASRN